MVSLAGNLSCIQARFILVRTGVSPKLGTVASLRISNLLPLAYMQPIEFHRISLTHLPAVAMTLVSSNMSSSSLLIHQQQALCASCSACSAARCSRGGLQVPARIPGAPYKDISILTGNFAHSMSQHKWEF